MITLMKRMKRIIMTLLCLIIMTLLFACALQDKTGDDASPVADDAVANSMLTDGDNSDVNAGNNQNNSFGDVETIGNIPSAPYEPTPISYGLAPVAPVAPAASISVEKPQITEENYPRVDGSTANIPLMASLYSEICGVPIEKAEGKVIASGGTGNVWNSMLNDTADLLLVYEAPESFHREISAKGLEIAPIGRDGLVFLVNVSNPVNDLSTSQLIDIYTGKLTGWNQVGGEKGFIAAFQRNEDSGSQTLFLKLLMKDTAPMDPLPGFVPGQMSDLLEGVADYDGSGGAIGYSVFYYASMMYANPNIKLLSVNGVAPSTESIRNGSYPLTNEFYVVIRASEPEDSPVRQMRDWLLTEEGGRLLTEAGYVSIR